MKLIVGLGNPGLKFIDTRHNIGFKILDFLAQKNEVKFKKMIFNEYFYIFPTWRS